MLPLPLRPWFLIFATAVLAVLGLLWLRATWGPPADPVRFSATRGAGLLTLTGTTARLRGEDALRTVISYAQAIYAVDQDQDRPGAVILVRDDDPATAIASTRLQHFPVNAPLLYVTDMGGTLPEATRDELHRLDPEGVMMDHNVQVYLVGDIAAGVERDVQAMGFRTRAIRGETPLQTTERLDEYLAVLEANHPAVVLVGASQELLYALPAASWNAHMGQALAWVTSDGVPPETRRMLERRGPNYPYIFVFAPQRVVNDEVMAELSRYGHVQRIPGATPQEMAVYWAGYKDLGRRLGWWFGDSSRDVGWGVAEPGHNVTLANPADWRTVVPSGVLSHMGKHALLLLTNDDGTLPESAVTYLEIIKPTRTHPSQQVFNFGWVVGDNIPDATVQRLSELLSVTPPAQGP